MSSTSSGRATKDNLIIVEPSAYLPRYSLSFNLLPLTFNLSLKVWNH